MQTMEDAWEEISFPNQLYRESGVSTLCNLDDIQATLEDQIVKTQTIRGAQLSKDFENKIKVSFQVFSGSTHII